MASIFGGYYGDVRRGIQRSEDRYEQKRLKNLELWRQFQADAIAEGREVTVDEFRSFIDQLADGSNYLRGFLPADKLLPALKARQDERVRIRRQEEVAASLARRQQANAFFQSTLENSLLQQEDDAKAAETFLGSFQTPEEQELARGFLQSRNLQELRDQVYTRKVTELMPHVQGMRPDMIKAMFGKQLPAPVLDMLMKREEDRKQQEAEERYRVGLQNALNVVSSAIASNPALQEFFATGKDPMGASKAWLDGVARQFQVKASDLTSMASGLGTMAWHGTIMARNQAFFAAGTKDPALLRALSVHGPDSPQVRALMAPIAAAQGTTVDAIPRETLDALAKFAETTGAIVAADAVVAARSTAIETGQKLADEQIKANELEVERYANTMTEDAHKAALGVVQAKYYVRDVPTVAAAIEEADGVLLPDEEARLVAAGVLVGKNTYKAELTESYVDSISPPRPRPWQELRAQLEQFSAGISAFEDEVAAASDLTVEQFEAARAGRIKEAKTALDQLELVAAHAEAYEGLSEDTMPELIAIKEQLKGRLNTLAFMPVPEGLKTEAELAQEKAAALNVPIMPPGYTPQQGTITQQILSEVPPPPNTTAAEARFTATRAQLEFALDAEAQEIAKLPPEQWSDIINAVAERMPVPPGFDARWVRRRLREKLAALR